MGQGSWGSAAVVAAAKASAKPMQIRGKNFIFVIMSCLLLIFILLWAVDEFFMADCGKVVWKFVFMGELFGVMSGFCWIRLPDLLESCCPAIIVNNIARVDDCSSFAWML